MRKSTVKRQFTSLVQDSSSGSLFTFGQLSQFFSDTWLVLDLPQRGCTKTFCWDGSHSRGLWVHVHTYYGTVHPPFWPPKSLPVYLQTGEFSLTSEVVILSLYFSSAQLLPLALSVEGLGEKETSILVHLTNSSCLAQGPISYLISRTRMKLIQNLLYFLEWRQCSGLWVAENKAYEFWPHN